MASTMAEGRGESKTLSKRSHCYQPVVIPPIESLTECQRRPYDPKTNPQGMITLSVSENHVCYDLISKKIEDPKLYSLKPWMLQYCDKRGILYLRQAIADYLTSKTKAKKPVNPEDISVVNGAESLIAALAMTLCDPGDGMLIPAPTYGGTNCGVTFDITRMAQVKPVYAHLGSQVNFDSGEKRPFELTVKKLEVALEKAKQEGTNVRALFLINPNNPLGDIYPPELLRDCLQFAHRHSLHIIFDEMYMGTILDPDVSFTSVLSLDDIPDPQRTHFIWGFSKDFGLSGFRCAVLHSLNSELHEAMETLCYFYCLPSITQHVLAEFISDQDWINNVFFPTNLQRLRESLKCMSDGLTKLGIPHLHRSAGLYVWADFRLYLTSPTVEAEMALLRRFETGGVKIAAGSKFDCNEPGWFRIIYAHPIEILSAALERLGKVLQEVKKEICGDGSDVAQGLDSLLARAFGETTSSGNAEGAVTSGASGGNLDDLVTLFKTQMTSSDWLTDNTAEKWVTENPDLYADYKAAAKK